MQHLEPDSIESGRLKRVSEHLTDRTELVATFQCFSGTSDGNMVCNDLPAASGALQNRKHFAKFVVTQLLDRDKYRRTGQCQNECDLGGSVQKYQAHKSEPRCGRVQQKHRFAL